MVFKILFEADVDGLASTKRVTGEIYVFSKDVAQARHFAEGYLSGSYSDRFAILEAVPLPVLNLEAMQ